MKGEERTTEGAGGLRERRREERLWGKGCGVKAVGAARARGRRGGWSSAVDKNGAASRERSRDALNPRLRA